MLAQKFGVAIPEAVEGDEARRDAGLRESLLKVHEIAAAYFREQLAALPARGRGSSSRIATSTPQTIEALGLGFAPPGTRRR